MYPQQQQPQSQPQQHSPLPQQHQQPRPSPTHQQYAGHPQHSLQPQAMYPQEHHQPYNTGYVNPNLYPGYAYSQQPMTSFVPQQQHPSSHPYPIYAPPHGGSGIAGPDGAYYYYDQSQQYLPIPQGSALPYSTGPSPNPSPSPSLRTTVNRSPRPANGSGRMSSFVFPPPTPTTKRGSASTAQHTSHPSIASSASVSSANLPAKPNFEPASSEGGSSSHGFMRLGGPNVPSIPALAHRTTNGTVKIAQELLDNLPPLPPVSTLPAQPSDDGDLREYIVSLQAILTSYKAREEAMDHRIQALAFRPADALRIMRQRDGLDGSGDIGEESISSITGVRLLQKVAELQKENQELGSIVASRNNGNDTQELQDAHSLIANLSQALTEAEEKASKAQRALQAAVDSRSVGFS